MRMPINEADVPYLLDQLIQCGEGAPSLDQKISLLRNMRSYTTDTSDRVDQYLLAQVHELSKGLGEALDNHDKLSALVEKVMSPPWYPATLLDRTLTERGEVALIAQGKMRSLVEFGPGVNGGDLHCGDEVLISRESNFIIATPLYPLIETGEIAVFDRYSGAERLVLQQNNEEFVVASTEKLRQTELRRGDLVRWDPNMLLAFEKLEDKAAEDLFLEGTPKESFADIGGLDQQIRNLQQALRLHLKHPEVARRYQLRRKGSVLLAGPPGTGKTMLARALANWIAQLSPSGRSRFINIKPGGLHSMWFGQSEAKYREVFRLAREAGEREPDIPVVMFFDEIDSIGLARGGPLNRVDDKVLTAFMTELDGLETRGNILVVGATNRRDVLDPALLRPGRLGDLIMDIPRPDLRATRDILGKHLSSELPFFTGDALDQTAARTEMIEAITTMIFAPNGLGSLANITLRDGTQRRIEPKDLLTGAVLAKVATDARDRAGLRAMETEREGICLDDLVSALNDELRQLAETLTPANCRQHIDGLPHDLDVTRVEPIRRRAVAAVRYLNAA